MITLISPENGFVFDTHTDIQNGFISRIENEGIENALVWLSGVKDDKERTYPEELRFTWDSDEDEFTFMLSENEDFSSPRIVKTNKKSITQTNLKTGTKYFWRVNECEPNTFETVPHWTRFIKIDGTLNVRDIGGGNLKQGLFYRGGELNRCFTLTDEGIDMFKNVLKIKTEIDLRAGLSESFHFSGAQVIYKLLPYRPYKEVFEEQHIEGIRRIMEFLADETNYPVYVHCMGGADRTGMIALYLRALLGESDDMIHKDYEMTGLSTYALGAAENAHGFRRRNAPYYVEFINMLEPYAPGRPFSEKIPAFLLSCGVKQEHIDKIREIFRKD